MFFANAVFAYAVHGYLRDTDNQLQKPHVLGRSTISNWQMMVFMWMLAAAEIGGFAVLLAGAMKGLFALALQYTAGMTRLAPTDLKTYTRYC